MSIRIPVLVCLLALTLVRCSMTDDVKEAKDTSKEMNGKMDKMIDKSDVLVDRTSNLFADARKDLGFERVTTRYEDIVNAKGDSTKLLYATALATSYEFQQWTGTKSDTPELKERLNAKAMRDLLPRFESLIDHHYSPDTHFGPFPTLPDNDWKSLASLAVVLGEIDQDQQIAAARAGIQTESLYSLIVKGLQYKKKSLYSTDIPAYAREVLAWEQEAVLLLQMRHNYFVAMVMSRFSDFCTGKMTGGKWSELTSWLDVKALGRPLDLKYASNIVKIQDQAVLWLQMAQETQRVLKMLGYPLQFNRGIMDIFSGVKFTAPAELVGLPIVDSTFSQLNQVTEELQNTYKSGEPAQGEIPDKLIAPTAAVY